MSAPTDRISQPFYKPNQDIFDVFDDLSVSLAMYEDQFYNRTVWGLMNVRRDSFKGWAKDFGTDLEPFKPNSLDSRLLEAFNYQSLTTNIKSLLVELIIVLHQMNEDAVKGEWTSKYGRDPKEPHHRFRKTYERISGKVTSLWAEPEVGIASQYARVDNIIEELNSLEDHIEDI